nr:IS66 family transposase [Mycoavidus cysteinexigens]
MAARCAHWQNETDKIQAELRLAQLKIQALTLELAHHKRLRFGHKSEALTSEQRSLFEETWETDLGEIQAQVTEHLLPSSRTPRQSAGRQALPEHLPRIEHRHEPESCDCAQCGQALVKISEDVSEQLDVEPARFFVHRHIRPQYACRACETMSAAPVPAAIIDGGLASPGLLTWITASKYLDHLPLYRLEAIAERQGVHLARSSLAQWIGQTGAALQPLAERLAELLRERAVLHADETPVAQLDPGKGKTKRAYLWAYRSNDLDTGPPIAVFDYQLSRSGSHAQTFLQGWQGDLVVDDFKGYKALFSKGIAEVGCMAHARRKFFDLYAANQSPLAQQALEMIGELYEIEKRARASPGECEALRRKETIPKLQTYHQWLLETRVTVADNSALARAIDYSLRRWQALSRFAHSANLPIDNNAIENIIRPIAVGRKNWLFIGSERAGRRAAAIQSLFATAKLNGLDPAAWLKDTLEKLPAWPHRRIDELLPLPPPL